MKYQLNNIRSEGLSLEGVLEANSFNIQSGLVDSDQVTGISPIAYTIRLSRAGKTVFVKGMVKTTVQLNCGRCLDPFDFPLRVEFSFILVPDEQPETRPPEKELLADDLDTEFYDGETVDIEKIVQNNVLLSLPIKPLCREACEGLCPVCGVNKNLETCTCSPEEPGDPRLAGLKNFFKYSKIIYL